MTLDQFLGIAETTLVFCGLIFAGVQVRQAKKSLDEGAKQHLENNNWNKKIAAQDALDKISNSVILSKINAEFDYINKKSSISIDEINSKIETDPDLQIQIFDLLNAYEKIARGVNLGIYDEEVIRFGRRRAMTKAYNAFSELVRHRREIYGARTAWCELEKLINRWGDPDEVGYAISN